MARLCSAGLATVRELVDADGPWSVAMMETMLPRAMEIETKREQTVHRATKMAIAAMFQEGGAKGYSDALNGVLDQIDGKPKVSPAAAEAQVQALKEALGKMRKAVRKGRGKK